MLHVLLSIRLSEIGMRDVQKYGKKRSSVLL
jgi:hypothetical protein